MKQISYEASARALNAIDSARTMVTIGTLRPSQNYWSADECRQRAIAEMKKAIAALESADALASKEAA